MDEKQTFLDVPEMSAEELVRALTLDKENYTDRPLQSAARELERRKIDLAQFINQVKVGLNDAEPESCSIDTALAKLKQEISPWEVWRFVNCLQEMIDVQKEGAFWTVHFFENEETYRQSFVIKNFSQVEVFVEQFLRLSGGSHTFDFEYNLVECDTYMEDSSGDIKKVSTALAGADIPHTVRKAEWSLHILLPPEYRDAADDVADDAAAEIESKIQELRDEITALEENHAPREQLLEHYNQLVQLVEGDREASYHRAMLLFELGRNEEAAEAFIEAADACSAFDKYWQTVESHLERLSTAMPKNLGILHCLADMARDEKNDAKIKERYEKILAVSPSDSIAHLNLANLYFEDPYYHAQAAKHFRSYLESQPDDENRAALKRRWRLEG
jgi:tetratricopeptide (TPR) repeat protein